MSIIGQGALLNILTVDILPSPESIGYDKQNDMLYNNNNLQLNTVTTYDTHIIDDSITQHIQHSNVINNEAIPLLTVTLPLIQDTLRHQSQQYDQYNNIYYISHLP